MSDRAESKRYGGWARVSLRADASARAVPSIVRDVVSEPGQALELPARASLEAHFGHDFSQVRVHADARAARSARSLGALAYTAGRDVVFASGQYAPKTAAGQSLLAHELTHVVQQTSSAARPTAEIGESSVYEQEADRMAEHVARSPAYPSSRPPMFFSRDRPWMVRSQAAPALPVPDWFQLPDHAQLDLSARGYTQTWYDSKPPNIRLTILNIYVKLKGLELWNFVGNESGTDLGRMVFASSDTAGLKRTLTDRDDFTSPEESELEWSSREMRVSGALHFKHFAGWPKNQVEAHIDQIGLLMLSKWWWLIFPVPLIVMAAHGLSQESYKDVEGIRDILIDQGWDPATLRGVGREGDYPGKGRVASRPA